MLNFQPTTPSDRKWVLPLLQAEPIPLCSYNFSTFFCWRHVYHHEICQLENRLLVHAQTSVGSCYLWPVGSGDVNPALDALEADARERGEIFRLIGILPAHLPLLEARYGSRMEVLERRDNYDYHYEIDRLVDLPGKKLHAKRNHIRRFFDQCPEASFSPLTPDDIQDCLELDRHWYREHIARGGSDDEQDSLLQERAALVMALEFFDELGMSGGLMRCHGKVLAFTLGSSLTEDVFDVQFERALSDFQGAFPVINQEFSRYIRDTKPEIRFIDREEDMGQPGLRKAKLSYGPDRLMENFCVLIQP